jgi:hypothetical protein
VHARFGGGEFFLRHLAGAHVFRHLPDAGARADLLPAKLARQHWTATDTDRRYVAARRAHQQRGSGLVAAHQQHDAVERIAANGFFDVHAREIAEQHRGRTQLRLAERHHGKFEREPAGFVHAALHELRELAEVAVTRRQFAPRVADADDGAAVEKIVGVALVLDPAAMEKTILAFSSEPRLTATRTLFWNIHRCGSLQGSNICEQ